MNVSRITRALLVLVFASALVAALVPLVNDMLNRHVLAVRVSGKFDNVLRLELEDVVRKQLQSTGFFEVDVESLRRAAVSLPWVRDVAVRRVWPDSVHIVVVEREAVARWNDEALLEDDATIFEPREGVKGYALTQLFGPTGQHPQVLEEFKRLTAGLGGIGDGIAGLSLSERGQWEIRFVNGMTIVPPVPIDVTALLQFSRSLPSILGSDLPRVARVDMRYANGFAVRWREDNARSGAADEDDSSSRGGKG